VDLEESMEVDMEELQLREEEAVARRKKLFVGIECELSCYLFSKVR
jgi:hypothetical protein